jgi:hypothetical protein
MITRADAGAGRVPVFPLYWDIVFYIEQWRFSTLPFIIVTGLSVPNTGATLVCWIELFKHNQHIMQTLFWYCNTNHIPKAVYVSMSYIFVYDAQWYIVIVPSKWLINLTLGNIPQIQSPETCNLLFVYTSPQVSISCLNVWSHQLVPWHSSIEIQK